jgi:hypothetical protein
MGGPRQDLAPATLGSAVGQAEEVVSGDRLEYGRAILSEARMMLDFLAVTPAKTIQDVKFADPAHAEAGEIGAAEVLARLDGIDGTLAADPPRLSHLDLAFLQLVRDTLSRLVAPVTGLSIAYTTLASGTRWGSRSRPRTKLAEIAYPDFVALARLHRWWQAALLALSVLLIGVAVWESTKVALGKSLLQNLERLRIQQTTLSSEKARLEATLDKVSDATISPETIAAEHRLPLESFSLCDRHYVLEAAATAARVALPQDESGHPLALRTSPTERDTCDRDHLLALNFKAAQDDLRQYYTYLPRLAGSSFETSAGVLRWSQCTFFGCAEGRSGAEVRCTPDESGAQPPLVATSAGTGAEGRELPSCDIELRVAPLLLVWGNYNLPIVFAFLGASIYVILDYFSKVRGNLLLPRDSHLSLIRLVLGLVTGACIGLFFSSYGPSAPTAGSDLISSLSLSASGIAFLAGFGVEGVFTMLEGLVSRVFPSEQK